MLVYGDRSEPADPRVRLSRLPDVLESIEEMVPGVGRHAALVETLVETGRLLQGVADADFARHGADRSTPATHALGGFLHALASAVCRSWDSGFTDLPSLPRVPQCPALPEQVELRMPEGYAYYAVYPEAYVEAVRRLRLAGPARLIGLRSIGTSLAAAAAAAIGAPPAVTLRPTGDPLARRVELSPDLSAELLAVPLAHYVIVDEGPGRSGSSFGAVADWLESQGIPPERIAFLPSHAAPLGPDASPRHRARWSRAQKEVADLGPRLSTLAGGWASFLLGAPVDRLTEVSAGAWREDRYADEKAWPAVVPAFERRKFLASAGGETWLLKFAGLGAEGRRKLDIARTLHAAGFVPEPRGLVHGFIVERWHGEVRPGAAVPQEVVARYLGVRSRLLSRDGGFGASLEDLFEMSRRNAGLALGPWTKAALDRWTPRLGALSAHARPLAVDGRLDRHEWLQSDDGRWLKCDALDHHAAHDPIGCQDLAWDVAGATVELELDEEAAEDLTRAVEAAAGRPVDRELIEFLTMAYLAFRLGQVLVGAEAQAGTAEATRLDRRAQAYAQRLEDALRARQNASPPPASELIDTLP